MAFSNLHEIMEHTHAWKIRYFSICYITWHFQFSLWPVEVCGISWNDFSQKSPEFTLQVTELPGNITQTDTGTKPWFAVGAPAVKSYALQLQLGRVIFSPCSYLFKDRKTPAQITASYFKVIYRKKQNNHPLVVFVNWQWKKSWSTAWKKKTQTKNIQHCIVYQQKPQKKTL